MSRCLGTQEAEKGGGTVPQRRKQVGVQCQEGGYLTKIKKKKKGRERSGKKPGDTDKGEGRPKWGEGPKNERRRKPKNGGKGGGSGQTEKEPSKSKSRSFRRTKGLRQLFSERRKKSLSKRLKNKIESEKTKGGRVWGGERGQLWSTSQNKPTQSPQKKKKKRGVRYYKRCQLKLGRQKREGKQQETKDQSQNFEPRSTAAQSTQRVNRNS